MNISELVTKTKIEPSYYSVTLDIAITNAPDEIKRISFLADINEHNEITPSFYTKLVSWRLKKKSDVIVEIPSNKECNVKNALNFVSNLECELSLLPPDENKSEEKERFVKNSCVVMESLLSVNRRMYVYPVSGYLEFLIGEAIAGITTATPTDEYVIDTFYSKMSPEFVLEFKESIKKVVYDFFGGESEFKKRALMQVKATFDCLNQQLSEQGEVDAS
ncbi:hypothetical protein [Photobacterium kishitanii]|nr:hypothetical protein [Photobacterium kishitanii]